jgi:succinate dehydrogenase / fumarate reductase, cytochrome b subunit
VPRSDAFLDRHYFLLRRLHSLTGVVPIGVFLVSHLLTNSSIVWGMLDTRHGDDLTARGVGTFQHEVNFIHGIPFLLLTEVFGLWVPIAFHSILGLYYASTGRSNTARYSYQANRRYALQRVSGYLGIAFIFYHVATLRWGWAFLVPGGARWSSDYAASTMAQAIRGGTTGLTAAGLLVAAFYMLGVTLLVFHFANGLWTAAITWGLTVSRGAQRRWGYVCAGLGTAMMGLAWAAVLGFALLDPAEARRHEEAFLQGRKHASPPIGAPEIQSRVPAGAGGPEGMAVSAPAGR